MDKKLNKQCQDFLKGKINVNQIKKTIEKTYNTSAYNAKRLAETEVARCHSAAFDRFGQEVGIKKVRYNSILDRKTCDDCSQYDEKIYNFDKKPELPRHPMCRCYYDIVDDDYKSSGAIGKVHKNDYERKQTHANTYYESIRKRTDDVSSIVKNTGMNKNTISKIKDHIFNTKYDLEEGHANFYPDYHMSLAWQRLIEGKNIKNSDIILLKHERLESCLMNKYNYSYNEAHDITCRKYNYAKALKED